MLRCYDGGLGNSQDTRHNLAVPLMFGVWLFHGLFCPRLSLVSCEAISLLLVPRSLFRNICTPTYENSCPPFDGKIAHVVPAFCLVNRSCAGLLRQAQEQMSKRIVGQIVDVPVPQILHQIVDVPVPQIMEETVEAVSVPVPQIQEQIVELVKALFERCAVVQQILTGFFFSAA